MKKIYFVAAAVLTAVAAAGSIFYATGGKGEEEQSAHSEAENAEDAGKTESWTEEPVDMSGLLEAYGDDDSVLESQAFEQFLSDQLPVMFRVDGESGIYYNEYCSGGFLEEEEYRISRLDLDNDGKEELVIDSVGHYGAAIIDFRDGVLYFLAEGEGTAGICSYRFIDGEAWIVHSDTSHGGRQMFWFEKFNGDGEVVDQFTLSAEYWEEPEGRYTVNSDFTYREKKITMQEYEELRLLYMGW